jgi:quercetin dioxygenase-like cupin family protein
MPPPYLCDNTGLSIPEPNGISRATRFHPIFGATSRPARSRPQQDERKRFNMMTLPLTRRSLAYALAAIGIVAGLAFTGGQAEAGECPAGKMKVGAMSPSDVAAAGVTDTVIGAIDVAEQLPDLAGYQIRTRMLEIQPGGIVPWHSHDSRPALIYVLEGEVQEISSDCEVPITHMAGEVSAETAGVAHWWHNTGDTVVRLLSSDVVPVE